MHFPEIKELKETMDEVGLKAYGLEKKSGIAISTINDIISGETENPGYTTMVKLFNAVKEVVREQDKLKSGTIAGEICSPNLKKIKSSETIYQVEKKFEKYPEITTFPVFKGNKLIGLVTDTSLRKTMSASKNWKKLNVKRAMITRPQVVDYLTSRKTLETQLDGQDCVLVWKKDKTSILGIITNWDLRRLHTREEPKQSNIGNAN